MSEFVEKALGVVEGHGRELSTLTARLDGVEKADGECRDRQARAWEKLAGELEGIRANIGKLAAAQAEHATRHDVEAAGVTRKDHTLETVLKYLTPVLVVALGAWLKWAQ